MEIGHFQLQLIVSTLVIVGVAFVALICDFLKRNNEQLREMNIELKIRREEEQKRVQLAARPAETVERIEAPKLEVAVAAPRAVTHTTHTARERASAVGNKDASNKEKKRAVNAQALAAMERGATLATSGGRPRQAPAAAPKPEVIQPEIVKPAAKTAIKKDWNSLLNRTALKTPAPAGQDLLAAVVAATHSSKSDALPAGFQEGFVLNKLVQSRQPITGLVVSIGVNASRNADGSLPESVHELVQSLIGPDDFAAQSGEDEFLLIYPQERGASAQRRLSQIAQRLWDFQLRSLGSFQILFSWGGVEVRSESIEEAIASASERMQETKRGRKLLTMASQVELRQAV